MFQAFIELRLIGKWKEEKIISDVYIRRGIGMLTIMKILWFIIKLPFRILALVIVAPLSILGIMINLIYNMGEMLLGLFNIFMLIGFFGILHSQDWIALRSVVVIIFVEAIAILGVGVIQGIIEIVKDSLLSFGLGFSYGVRGI